MVDEFLREDLPCSGNRGSSKFQASFDVGYLGFLGWLVSGLWRLVVLFAEDRATPATESMTYGMAVNKMI